jgi:hypothetical protein
MAEGEIYSNGDFRKILDQLGIENEIRYESIVTTNGPHMNAAAIGVRRLDDKFHLRIFNMSNTFENIQRAESDGGSGKFAINLIDASQLELLCYAALRGWGSPIPEFAAEFFEKQNDVPVLKDAAASIICTPEKLEIEDIKDQWGSASRMELWADILEVLVRDPEGVEPIVRGPDEPLLDALVYATKFKVARGAMKDKCRNKVEELIEQAGRPGDVAHTLTMEALKEYFGILD